jgi:nitrile hydratase accessory protein
MERLRESMDALEGTVAPPRKNGELMFEAPWESRAFGMAVALRDGGAYGWEEFSAHLAAEIAEHDGEAVGAVFPVAPNAERAYYEHWLEALETLLAEKGILTPQELQARTAEFAAGMWEEH